MIVERNYWKGKLSGYQLGNMSVPLARENRDFQQIRLAIREGRCKVVEPTLSQVDRALDRKGNPSGFRTRFGFVSADRPSHLLSLIELQIANGTCTVVEPSKDTEDAPRFDSLVISTVLPQPWPGVGSECTGELAYRARRDSPEHCYRFTLRNLPRDHTDRVDTLLAAHGVTFGSRFTGSPLQFGALEIEIPVDRLRGLYFSERHLLPSTVANFVSDLAEQNLCESRRSKQEGPDIQWLINFASMYTAHFVVEFSNRVIDAFRFEFGKVPVEYVAEGYWREHAAVFGCESTGKRHFIGGHLSGRQDIPVPEQWHAQALQRYDLQTRDPDFLLRTALRRVAELVRLGFHVEALAPLNAFLEVLTLQTLQRCVHSAPLLVQHLDRMGHTAILEIVASIAQSGFLPILDDETFQRSIVAAQKIYKRRNAYVHSLKLIDVVGRPTLLDRRDLEELFFCFTDPHEQNQIFMRFNAIASDQGPLRAFIFAEVTRLYEGSTAKSIGVATAGPTQSA